MMMLRPLYLYIPESFPITPISDINERGEETHNYFSSHSFCCQDVVTISRHTWSDSNSVSLRSSFLL